MAKKKDFNVLPLNTIITVVAENTKEIVVSDMEYGSALDMIKKKRKEKSSFKYKLYQQGFCSIESKKKNV